MCVKNARPAKNSILNANQRKGHCYSCKKKSDRAGNRLGHISLLNTVTHLIVLKLKHNNTRHRVPVREETGIPANTEITEYS